MKLEPQVRLHTATGAETYPAGEVRKPATRVPVVLIVDTNEDSLALMRLIFESAGMTVAECHDGDRLVDESARLRPDLIVLEEWLPRVDGRTACRRLRDAAENIRDTPVIFIASSSDPSSARLAFEAGCTLYLVKPFDFDDLMDMAAELVARARPRAFA